MGLLNSCLTHAVKLCFVEQWLLRVFLVLNLVLLAIFFCSIYAKSESSQESNSCSVEMKIKKRRRCRRPVSVEASSDDSKSMKNRTVVEDETEQENVEVDGENTGPVISEEELNKRVEAFIAMFRQHLASDARRSRNHQFLSSSHKQTEDLKECNITQKVRCVVVQV